MDVSNNLGAKQLCMHSWLLHANPAPELSRTPAVGNRVHCLQKATVVQLAPTTYVGTSNSIPRQHTSPASSGKRINRAA